MADLLSFYAPGQLLDEGFALGVVDLGLPCFHTLHIDLSTLMNYAQVNPDHPIIREAHKNGSTLFVIATIYQAEHCNIEVSFAEKSRDTASAVVEASTTSSVPLLGANAGANLRDSKSTVKGIIIHTLCAVKRLQIVWCVVCGV